MLKSSLYLREVSKGMLAAIAAGDAKQAGLLAECVADEALELNPHLRPSTRVVTMTANLAFGNQVVNKKVVSSTILVDTRTKQA